MRGTEKLHTDRKAFEIDCAVISSCVGPIPPVVNTYLNFFERDKIVSIIVFCSSGIILTSFTEIPHFEFSQLDKNAIFI